MTQQVSITFGLSDMQRQRLSTAKEQSDKPKLQFNINRDTGEQDDSVATDVAPYVAWNCAWIPPATKEDKPE